MVYNPAFTSTDYSSIDRLRQQQASGQKTPYERQMAQYEAAVAAEDRRNQAEGRTSYDRLVRENQDYNQRRAQADNEIKAARDEAYGLVRGATTRRNPLDDQLQQMLQERAAQSGIDPYTSHVRQLMEGRVGQRGVDPATLSLLQGQANSSVGATPYDETTIRALMTQASDAAAQAQLNAKGRITGNASDPSVIAANNEADARRAQAVQQAQLGINSQANIANSQASQNAYALRGQAIGRLADYQRQNSRDQAADIGQLADYQLRANSQANNTQAANISQLSDQNRYINATRNANEQRLIDMLANERRTVQPEPGIPTYEEYARANGYGPRAILPPVQQAPVRQPVNTGTILHTGGNSGDTFAARAARFATNPVQTYQPGKVVTGMNKVDTASPVQPVNKAPNTVGPMAGGYQLGQQPQLTNVNVRYRPIATKNPYNTNMLPPGAFGG